jgi:Plasmid pRiA4b ORF-3-like protein
VPRRARPGRQLDGPSARSGGERRAVVPGAVGCGGWIPGLPGGDDGVQVPQDRGGDDGLRLGGRELVLLPAGQVRIRCSGRSSRATASEEELHEAEFRLADVAHAGERFRYDYDFGDSWEHEVLVERADTIRPALKFAVCLDGANACPPEDCGGTGGYAELLEVLANPARGEHEQSRQWAREAFNPEAFDLAEANAALQRLRWFSRRLRRQASMCR